MKKRNLLLTGMISITLPLLSASCIDNAKINQKNDDNDQVKQYRQEGQTLYIETEIINKDVIQKILEDKSINPETVTKIYSKKAKLVSFKLSNKEGYDSYLIKSNFINLKKIDLINVEKIDEDSFRDVDSLISINLPNVTEIGRGAFEHSGSLIEVNAPKLKKTHFDSFEKTLLVTEKWKQNENLIIGKVLVSGAPNISKIFNEEVEYVAGGAFSVHNNSSFSNLTSIDLPNVTGIGSSAFGYTYNLESVNLPNVTEIGSYAFAGTSSLKTFNAPKLKKTGYDTFEDSNLIENISNFLIIGKVLIRVNPYLGELSNTEVEYVAPRALSLESTSNYRFLTLIDLPNATEIGEYAFQNAVFLKTINLPNVTKINKGAFSFVPRYSDLERSLSSIDLPNVTEIGEDAFLLSSDLESVNAPKLKNIGKNAFLGTKFGQKFIKK